MATISPFDPFWRFVLDEDSDGDETVQRRRRPNQTEKETDKVKKVRFQLSRGSVSVDDEEDVSLLELASMDLRPRPQEQPDRRRLFGDKKKEKRDDDENWSILKLAFAGEKNEPQKPSQSSFSGRKKDPPEASKKESSFLSMIGLSPCESNDTDAPSKLTSKNSRNSKTPGSASLSKKDQREGELHDSGFLAMIGLSSSPSNDTDVQSKGSSKQSSGRGDSKKGAMTHGQQTSVPQKNLSALSEKFKFGGKKNPIFPDDDALPSNSHPTPRNQVKAQKKPTEPKEATKPRQPAKITKSSDEGQPIKAKFPAKKKQLLNPKKPTEEKEPLRFKRMQRVKAREKGTTEESSESQPASSSPISATLAAAGLAAIGIASAGVTAAGDLFDGAAEKNENRSTQQVKSKGRMSMLDFLDVFSSSEEESDEESDEESYGGYDSSSYVSAASSPSSACDSSQEKTLSPIKEIVIDNDAGWTSERKSRSKKKSARANCNPMNSELSARNLKTSIPSSAKVEAQLEKNVAKVRAQGRDLANKFSDQEVDADEENPDDSPSKKRIGHIAASNSSRTLRSQRIVRVGKQTDPESTSEPFANIVSGVNVNADGKTVEKIVVERKLGELQQMHASETPDEMAARTTPIAFYTYDDDPNAYMSVQYDTYGSRNEIYTHYESPASLLNEETDTVLVKIEASTISYSDCRIRRGEWWGQSQLGLPLVPGVDLVGKVERIDKHTESRFGLSSGDRVISLVKHGGNARYTKVCADQLVKVPVGVKPPEAVCLVEAYLSAFQAIHCGQRQIIRYKATSLSGKIILVLGVLTNVGRATVELAIAAGAELVYAPCKSKHRQSVQDMGATPLCLAKDDFMSLLDGKVDLIIDATSDIKTDVDNYFSALNENGDYLLVGRTTETKECILSRWAGTPKHKLLCGSNKYRLTNQVHSYDVYETWESNLECCKRDLAHLIGLLEAGVISPRVLDRVPLKKVAKIQAVLDEKRIQGFIVCEPWIKSMSREDPSLEGTLASKNPE